MRTKKGFELRDICGEKVILATGIENIDFSRMISVNETSAYLWQNVVGKDFTAETLTELLLKEYEVDEKTAQADAERLVAEWKECGIIEDHIN